MCLVSFGYKEKQTEKIDIYQKTNSPSWAYIELTNRCSENCKWCFADSKIGRTEDMDINAAKKILLILKNSGIVQVTFSGGEPLEYPYLFSVLKEAKQLGLRIHINTNGKLLNQKTINKLSKNGVNQIQFNTEGINKDNIMEYKELFRHTRLLKIESVAQIVVTKLNKSSIFRRINNLMKLHPNRIRFWEMVQIGKAKNLPNLTISDYPSFLEKVSEHLSKNWGMNSAISYEPFFPKVKSKVNNILSVPCPSNGMIISIDLKGNVFFCACALRSPILYNILDYKDITNIHKKMVQKIRNRYKCNCSLSDHCSKGCIGRIINNPNRIDPFCQLR